MALEAPAAQIRERRKTLSRAARLELIDLLSRWSAPGLAILAGAGVYLAITAGRGYPWRATAWALMLISALWACRSIRSSFRAGSGLSSRPFRWRASYTACLSVLGVAFASAPVLLTPSDAPGGLFLQTAGLTLFAASCAALLNAAHLSSAVAIAAPAALLVTLASARNGDIALTAGAAAAGLLCVSVVIAVSRKVAGNAARRHPRTRFLRREIPGWEHAAGAGAVLPRQAGEAKNAV